MVQGMVETQAYLNNEQTKKLEEAAHNTRDQLLIRLHRKLAARVGEILAIGFEDVNFDLGRITIIHEKVSVRLACPNCGERLSSRFKLCPNCGKEITSVIQKAREKRKTRTIPIDKDTLSLIKLYAENTRLQWDGKKHLLFPFKRNMAWRIITDAASRAGLPKIYNVNTGKIHNVSSHRLRDSFAVAAIKKDSSGAGLRYLQDHLGHASIGTTMNYDKIADEERQDWYDSLTKED